MTATEIVAELKTLGTEQTKKTLMRHGSREPVFGVTYLLEIAYARRIICL